MRRSSTPCSPSRGVVYHATTETKLYIGSKHYATTARHHCHRLLNRHHTLQYAGKLYLFKQILAKIVNYTDKSTDHITVHVILLFRFVCL